MKHLFSLIIFLCYAAAINAQDSKKIPAYQKDSMMPSFSLLNTDSSSWFRSNSIPKNDAVVIIYFSPECGHCQLTAHAFRDKMDSFKNVYFVWVSYLSISEIKAFGDDYNLLDLKNVSMGRDIKYYIPGFFKVNYTPYIAVYNKKRKLLQTYDGGTDPETILALLQDHNN